MQTAATSLYKDKRKPTDFDQFFATHRGKGMYKIRVENDIFFKSFSLKYQKLENTQRRKIQKLILEMIKFVKKDLNNLGRL